MEELRDQLEEQERRIAQLEDDKQDLESRLETEASRMKTLEEDKKSMQEELDGANAALERERETARRRQTRIGDQAKSGKALERERTRLMEENQSLRDGYHEVEGQMQVVIREMEGRDARISELEEQAASMDGQVAELRRERDEAQGLLEEARSTLDEARADARAERDASEASLRELRDEVDEWRAKAEEAGQALEEARTRAKAAEDEVEALRGETRTAALEAQVAEAREEAEEARRSVAAAQGEAEEARTAALRLAEELEEAKRGQAKAAEDAVRSERLKVMRLERSLQERDQRVKHERERAEATEREKGEVEDELAQAQRWMARYEEGHGLTDAVAYQRELKGQIRVRAVPACTPPTSLGSPPPLRVQMLNQRIEELQQEGSSASDAVEQLGETCRRLKQEAGRPEDFQYPDVELQEGKQGEVLRLRAEVRALESQLDQLESARGELLRKLRAADVRLVEGGMRFFGLDADQTRSVADYAARLRDGGDDTLPVTDDTARLRREKRAVGEELVQARQRAATAEAEAEELRAQLARAGWDARGRRGRESGEEGDPATQRELRALREAVEASRSVEATAPNAGVEALKAQVAALAQEIRGQRRGWVAQPAEDTSAQPAPQPAPEPASAQALAASGGGADERLTAVVETLQAKIDAVATATAELREGRGGEQAATASQLAAERARCETLAFELDGARRELQEKRDRAAHLEAEAARLREALQGVGSRGGVGSSTAVMATPRGRASSAGPQSPGGKRLQARLVREMQLPPEEWAEDMGAVQGQLVECLEQLARREEQLGATDEGMQQHVAALRGAADQMAMLYRAHITAREAWEQEVSRLQQALEGAEEDREALRARAARLDALEAALKGGDDGARAEVARVSRRLLGLEVDQRVLARRYKLREESEAAARARCDTLEREHLEESRVLRARVLYLELWKRGALARLKAMQRTLDGWVPATHLQAAERELADLRTRHADALAREAELRAGASTARSLPREVEALQARCETLESQLAETEKAGNALKEELERSLSREEAERQRAGGGGGGGGRRSELDAADPIVEVARLRGEMTRLEVEAAASGKRAEVGARRVDQLSASLREEAQRREEAEDSAAAVREEAREAAERLVAVRTQYEGGHTREEADAARAEKEALLARCDALEGEVERYREQAELASAQTQAVSRMREAQRGVEDDLRRQLEVAQSRSDDSAIIGRLQHQLLALKSSYQLFVRKHESARAQLRRCLVELSRLHKEADDKDAMLLALQEGARVRVLALERALARCQPPAGEGEEDDSSGTLLQQMQRLSGAVQQLTQERDKQEEAASSLRHALREAETGRDTTRLELRDVRRELEEIRACVQGDRQEGGGAGGGSPQSVREVVRRLSQLHDELRSEGLRRLRLQRELVAARSEVDSAQKRADAVEERARELEERNAEAESRLRTERLRAGAPPIVAGMANAVAELADDEGDGRAEADATATALEAALTGGAARGGKGRGPGGDDAAQQRELFVRPDGSTDTGDPLDAAREQQLVARLQAEQKTAEALREEVTSLRAQVRRQAAEGEEVKVALRDWKRRGRYLRRQLEAEGVEVEGEEGEEEGDEDEEGDDWPRDKETGGEDDEDDEDDGDGAGKGGKRRGETGRLRALRERQRARRQDRSGARQSGMLEADQRRLQAAAQQTVAGLKAVLARKNETLERYKQRMEEMRREAGEEREAERARWRDETERLHAEAQAATEKLRRAVAARGEEGGEAWEGGDEGAQEGLLERLGEAEDVATQRQRLLQQTEAELTSMRVQAAGLEEQVREAGRREASLQAENDQLRQQVESRAMDTLVKDLRSQLKRRESQVKQLTGELKALKHEMVKAQEEFEIALARTGHRRAPGPEPAAQSQEGGGQSASQRGGGEGGHDLERMTKQVLALRERVRTLREEAREAKEAVSEAKRARREQEEEMEALRQQASRAEAAVGSRQDRESALERDLAGAKRREEALKRTVASLREELGGGSGGSGGGGGRRGGGGGSEEEKAAQGGSSVRELQRRVQVLEAQNEALRGAAQGAGQGWGETTPRAAPGGGTADAGSTVGGDGGRTPRDEAAASRARAAWEANKKTERRVEVMGKRLRERGQELEVSRKQLQAAQDTVERLQRERSELQVRLASLAGKGNKSSADQLQRMVDAETLRERVAELEEALQRAERDGAASVREELHHARAECEALRGRVADLEERLARVGRRRGGEAKVEGGDDEEGGDGVQRARAEAAERRALSKDGEVLSLRFELEQSELRGERLQQRVRELEALRDEALDAARRAGVLRGGNSGGAGGGGGGSGTSKKRGGDRFRRERDLEAVVESQKRVVDKLKAEIERLRRAAAPSKDADKALKEVRRLRETVSELREENASLRERASRADTLSQEVAREKEGANHARRQLKERTAALRDAQLRAEAGERRARRLQEQLDSQGPSQAPPARQRGYEDEEERGGGGGDAATERKLRSQVAALEQELDEAKAAKVKAERRAAKADAPRGPVQGGSEAEGGDAGKRAKRAEARARDAEAALAEVRSVSKRAERDVAKLQEENRNLRRELDAFDMVRAPRADALGHMGLTGACSCPRISSRRSRT